MVTIDGSKYGSCWVLEDCGSHIINFFFEREEEKKISHDALLYIIIIFFCLSNFFVVVVIVVVITQLINKLLKLSLYHYLYCC